MSTTTIRVNGKPTPVEADPATPLLWVIREHLKLTGTKFGCGIAQCGACTVHVDGEATCTALPLICSVVAIALSRGCDLMEPNAVQTRA